MGKQEEIREEIAKMVLPPTPADYLTNAQLKTADEILNYLHSQGVVIAVVPDDTPQIYRAVEPLI